MKKKDLLSIGDLSKITGVHIKSLRYYDRLGILTPAYIDPDSGYRYYSFYQRTVVEAIQLCVMSNIPLKDFHNYLSKKEPWIRYTELIAAGAKAVEEKIESMQKSLSLLEMMQNEIKRSERIYPCAQPQECFLRERWFWTVPYSGVQFCDASQKLMRKTILEIHRQGLQIGYIEGLLLMRQNGQWKQYLFIETLIPEEIPPRPEIVHIPSGRYLCKKVEHSDLSQAWDWCLPFIEESQLQMVIETQLFTGNYYFSSPVLEQRCLISESNIFDEK